MIQKQELITKSETRLRLHVLISFEDLVEQSADLQLQLSHHVCNFKTLINGT